jgi:hypothetical protein
VIAELIGIIEIGGPRGFGLPLTSAQPLRLVQGVDNLARLRVFYSSGAKARVDPNAVVKLTVRKVTPHGPVVLAVLGVAAPQVADNAWEFSLSAAGLAGIAPGSYVYDVAAVTTPPGATDSLVRLSPLFVEPSAFSKV